MCVRVQEISEIRLRFRVWLKYLFKTPTFRFTVECWFVGETVRYTCNWSRGTDVVSQDVKRKSPYSNQVGLVLCECDLSK